MKIAVAVPTRNRPEWLRFFLLQMANQTVKPDIVIVYENGQTQSFRDDLFYDIPIKTDFIFSSQAQVPPDYAIPALRRALTHNPDVVFFMDDDNFYFFDHIEKTIAGFENGRYDVSYLSHGSCLAVKGEVVEYFKSLDWKHHFANMGVDDGFAMSARAAHQYIDYLEYASYVCKRPGWHPSYGVSTSVPATDHPSDGVRFAYLLHPDRDEYCFLRNVNFIKTDTMAWVLHGGNLSSKFDVVLPLVRTPSY